ncbi:MAG: DUF362 domain-containing protein [Dehalococcoidia bacterium]|nr:MAG: DUF362 domain-containing protein [Dehalococcoidia bacterium]
MIFNADNFYFKAPSVLSRARRVLIKPKASYPVPYPVTTSREMLSLIIKGIRQISDADILLLDGTQTGEPIYPIYQALGYDFPRILMLDVNDCIWVEVDNPLPKPLAVSTFWVPNVVLSSDYLISVSPLKIIGSMGHLAIMNLLSLLPSSKYGDKSQGGWGEFYNLSIENVLTDLYFTLPFDMGIIEARQKFTSQQEDDRGEIEECGQVFVGEPFQVDLEASKYLGIKTGYLNLIKEAEAELEI